MPLDATEIVSGLFMGSAPTQGAMLKRAGFDALVLTAEEFQPPDFWFGGVEVLRAPMRDALPDAHEVSMAHAVADEVARRLAAGQKVLVTCFAGRNRSGWVTALALVKLGMPPKEAIARIRRARPLALSNHAFNNDILRATR